MMHRFRSAWCCCKDGPTKGNTDLMQSVAPRRSSSSSAVNNGPDAAAGGMRGREPLLWARALEVITSTERSRGEVVDEEQRASALVAAMTENPKAAKKVVQAFTNRAILGIDVQLLRVGQESPVCLQKVQLRLTPHFDSVLLKAGERERGFALKEIIRVSAGLPQGVTGIEHARSATLELESGDGVVMLFLKEEDRNEFVLCMLMLTDSAHGRSLSLNAGKGSKKSQEGEGDDGAGPASPRNKRSSSKKDDIGLTSPRSPSGGCDSPRDSCNTAPVRDRSKAPSVKSAAALVKSKVAFAGAVGGSECKDASNAIEDGCSSPRNRTMSSPRNRGSASPRGGGASPRNVGSASPRQVRNGSASPRSPTGRSKPTVAFASDENPQSSPKVKSSSTSAAASSSASGAVSPKGLISGSEGPGSNRKRGTAAPGPSTTSSMKTSPKR